MILPDGTERVVMNLSITRLRDFENGELKKERFSIATDDAGLLLEDGHYIDAEQALAEYITRDVLVNA